MKTLDIGRKTIDYTIKRKEHGTFEGVDKRGKDTPTNKISEESIEFIHRHIKMFPRVESHYARKKTKKEYLPQDLNIKQMWKLYVEECKKDEREPVTQAKYRQVFCDNYNISFFKPKKDQCSTCESYNRAKQNGNVTEDIKLAYDEHQLNKTLAREQKEKDKKKSKEDPSYYTATFDLQAVLTTPCSLVSELYYSRKLCCYNLTIYSLSDKNAFCHLWDETQGKRGSSEIATCLMKNTASLCSMASPVRQITYYSDTCGGQNRNKFVAASLLFCVTAFPNIEKINHKFLQSGHSHMECDSVHSTIETAKRKTEVFVPSQWSTVISLARKDHPYVVVPLKFDHVLDWKDFAKNQCPNMKKTSTGANVNWLNVKWVQTRKTNPRSVFINYSFDETCFLEIEVQNVRTKCRRQAWPTEVGPLYTEKLPIASNKKKDLMNLCKKGIIPEDCHGYFAALRVDSKSSDRAPFPAFDEESDDTDKE